MEHDQAKQEADLATRFNVSLQTRTITMSGVVMVDVSNLDAAAAWASYVERLESLGIRVTEIPVADVSWLTVALTALSRTVAIGAVLLCLIFGTACALLPKTATVPYQGNPAIRADAVATKAETAAGCWVSHYWVADRIMELRCPAPFSPYGAWWERFCVVHPGEGLRSFTRDKKNQLLLSCVVENTANPEIAYTWPFRSAVFPCTYMIPLGGTDCDVIAIMASPGPTEAERRQAWSKEALAPWLKYSWLTNPPKPPKAEQEPSQ